MELNCMSTFPMSDDLLRYDDNKLTKPSDRVMPLAMQSQHQIWQVVVAVKEAYQGDPYCRSISCFTSIITTVCYCVLASIGSSRGFKLSISLCPEHPNPYPCSVQKDQTPNPMILG